MADTKISALSAVTAPSLSDVLPIVDSATTKKVTVDNLGAVVAPLTTKGDILTFDTDRQRLAVGSNGQQLTADSAQATGVKWAVSPETDAIAAKGDLLAGTGAKALAALTAGANFTHRLVPDSAQTSGLAWQRHLVRRTADATPITASTTLASDDTLLFAIGANDIWFFQAMLLVSADNTVMDAKFGWAVPASATMQWNALGTVAGAAEEAVAVGSTPNVVLTESGTLSLGTAAGTVLYQISGYVTGRGTGGNVNLQWAQNTSDAGNLALLKNSCIVLERLS